MAHQTTDEESCCTHYENSSDYISMKPINIMKSYNDCAYKQKKQTSNHRSRSRKQRDHITEHSNHNNNKATAKTRSMDMHSRSTSGDRATGASLEVQQQQSKPLHETIALHNLQQHAHTHGRQLGLGQGHEQTQQQQLEQQSQGSSTSSSGQDDSAMHVVTSGSASNATTTTSNSATNSSTASSGEENGRYSSDIKRGTEVDEYGLPVPSDGHLQHERAHAAVVARLPAPEMKFPTCFSSSSASSSEKGDSKPAAVTTNVQIADDEWSSKRKHSQSPTQPLKKRRPAALPTNTSENNSSGSGTEGGYAGENSSSDKPSSCSSPSLSSGEDRGRKGKRNGGGDSSSTSTIADYDSSDLANDDSSPAYSDESSSDEELPRKMVGIKMEIATRRKLQGRSILQTNYESAMRSAERKKRRSRKPVAVVPERKRLIGQDMYGKPAIMVLSCDLMAHCMTFLEPPEVHDLLTAPLSKDWRSLFTMPQDLWRVLCLTEPFNAKFDADEGHDSDESSFPMHSGLEVKHLLGRYRLLYTSFVRCMRYLSRIKDDAVNGRAPSILGYNGGADTLSLRSNENLKTFLARARGIIVENKKKHQSDGPTDESSSSGEGNMDNPIGVTDENSSVESIPWTQAAEAAKKPKKSKPARPQFGYSQLTQRLLGPSKTGAAGNVNLPWSCAIYSIVNWMVAFADVEGIQTMCLKVLPFLLEDESQRTTSQRAGLTDIVLRGMVLFPDSIQLHTAAFHTIVLLARPLGGREGMLFHCSMVNSSGIFHDGCQSGKNGIAVMLDSMRRFESDEVLQAMSCWSLVNIALAPSQKAVLVKLGGISVVANAMMQHPFNTEVQFRALFALINLVIPSVNLGEGEEATANQDLQDALGEVNNTSEREMLDDSVSQIANLVVVAMKNFCASESILNRACLVLHNLSLTEEYHVTLLWTPNCYQMLEWCLANYRTDQILQQSAAGTLHRLQTTLAGNDDLRQRFTSSLQSQQQSSLEQAHREALLLHQQTEQLALQQRP